MKITELVTRAKQGDQDAWGELYKETRKEAYFVALKVCGSAQDAEDLAHDAFLMALEKSEQLEQPEKFRSWLNMIVANKCRDYLKRKKPMLFSELESDNDEIDQDIDWEDDRETSRPELTLDRKETIRLVSEIIDGLPEDQKLCIMMYYREDLSVAQIAQALQVSEGTVKSRLNYARQKVKKRVEELERQGTKLYGMAPLPFLAWLLDGEAATLRLPERLIGAAAGWNASQTIAAGETAAATAAADTGAKTILAGVTAKVVAGLATVAIVAGGIAGYVRHADTGVLPPPAESEVMQSDGGMMQLALTAYEDLLRTGVTADGMEIFYYTHLDLNQDGVPELLVADDDGTCDSWTSAELYCYRNDEVTFCGDTDSRWDYFYIVNDTYVLGMSRMGNRYVSLDGLMATMLYYWNEDNTCNDPAILSYPEGSHDTYEYVYISMDEFDYYNYMPSEVESPGENSFIETAVPITLQENPYGYISLETPSVIVCLPAGWREKFAYQLGEENTSHVISVYEKESYKIGGGLLFSILRYEQGEDYSYLPNYETLGVWTIENGEEYEFVLSFPSDLQFMPEQQESYQELNKDIPWIREHLVWKVKDRQ